MKPDLLRMDYINSLPQPFFVSKTGKDWWWPVYDIDVQTGLTRIDACGMLDITNFAEWLVIRDASGTIHDPDTFYTDYEEEPATQEPQG